MFPCFISSQISRAGYLCFPCFDSSFEHDTCVSLFQLSSLRVATLLMFMMEDGVKEMNIFVFI